MRRTGTASAIGSIRTLEGRTQNAKTVAAISVPACLDEAHMAAQAWVQISSAREITGPLPGHEGDF